MDEPERARGRGINSKVTAWQQKADDHQRHQKVNPFSGSWKGPARYQHLGHRENDENYGRPVQGSKTELRGKAAGVHVSSEIVELCSIIEDLGTRQTDGTSAVSFGDLFEFYTRISNKVVGMLLRARKQGLVEFEGEMLYQRRDDDVIIRLIRTPQELMEDIERSKKELRHHPASKSLK